MVWTRNYKLNYNNANRPNQHCSNHSWSALKVWPLKPALHSQKRSHFFYIARNINSLKQAYKSWKIKTWVPLSKGNFSISKVSAPAQKFYFPSQHLHFRIAYCISCTPNRRLFHLYHQIHILFFFIKLDFPNYSSLLPKEGLKILQVSLLTAFCHVMVTASGGSCLCFGSSYEETHPEPKHLQLQLLLSPSAIQVQFPSCTFS